MESDEEYFPGKGCTCYAWNEDECGCGVDWTDPEIYELRDRIRELEQQQCIPISEMLPIDEEFDDLVGRRIEEARSTKCRHISKSADKWTPVRKKVEDMLAESLARSHKVAPPYQEYYRGLIYGLEAALAVLPQPPTAEDN